MRGRLASLLLTCAGLVATTSSTIEARADAPAEDKRSSITVIAAPGDRFGQRVLAELELLGFSAIRVDPPNEPASRASLEASARASGALAAIRAVPSARGAEVWIADRVTGKTVLREIVIDAGTPDPEAALALRVVELLRASLLELSLPAPPPGEVPAPPEIREKLALPAPGAMARRAPPTLRLSIAPGVLASPGGFGPAAALDVGLAWMPFDHVGVSAFASIPLTRPRVSGTEGSADLAALLLGGGVRFLFTTRASRWAPSADLGVAALSMKLTSSAAAGYHAVDASAWTAAPFARLGLAFAPIPELRVRADLLAAVATDSVSVLLAGRDAATFGRPIALASAGVDLGWF
ncbi:MAG: hypothetical protein QM820_49195 [Minicystis sp.]